MMNMGPGSIRGGCVQGDDVTITTFFLAVGIPTLSTAISEARRYAEAGGDARGPGGWGQRVFTFGLFAVAALFLAAGFYWWLLRGRSWRITVILQQVATSWASWIILLFGLVTLVWFRRRKILALMASVNQNPLLSRIPPLLLVAIIVAEAFAIIGMALSGTTRSGTTVALPHTLGVHNTLRILDTLKQQPPQVSGGLNVIIMGPSESASVQAAVKIILEKGVKDVYFKDLPNYYVDLDAPPIPDPQFSGVIIHGRNNAVTEALRAPFAGCLDVIRTQNGIEPFAR